jgi:hypothetical protein
MTFQSRTKYENRVKEEFIKKEDGFNDLFAAWFNHESSLELKKTGEYLK